MFACEIYYLQVCIITILHNLEENLSQLRITPESVELKAKLAVQNSGSVPVIEYI